MSGCVQATGSSDYINTLYYNLKYDTLISPAPCCCCVRLLLPCDGGTKHSVGSSEVKPNLSSPVMTSDTCFILVWLPESRMAPTNPLSSLSPFKLFHDQDPCPGHLSTHSLRPDGRGPITSMKHYLDLHTVAGDSLHTEKGLCLQTQLDGLRFQHFSYSSLCGEAFSYKDDI